jgi:hypothetical protein
MASHITGTRQACFNQERAGFSPGRDHRRPPHDRRGQLLDIDPTEVCGAILDPSRRRNHHIPADFPNLDRQLDTGINQEPDTGWHGATPILSFLISKDFYPTSNGRTIHHFNTNGQEIRPTQQPFFNAAIGSPELQEVALGSLAHLGHSVALESLGKGC